MNTTKKKLKISKNFSDLKDEDNFIDFIDDLADRKIINGFEGNLFKPNNEISRAELLKLILNITEKTISKDENTYFLDVRTDAWYKRYINTALENKIISKATHFNPNMPVIRIDGLKMILLSVLGTFSLKYSSNFLDVKTSDWFLNYVEYATRNGLIRDLGQYFYPNKKLTRLEVMYIFYKI